LRRKRQDEVGPVKPSHLRRAFLGHQAARIPVHGRGKTQVACHFVGRPPEQATGTLEEIDHRADQWSLACIAWEMLLGRSPSPRPKANPFEAW
jgi:serine/threonine protein kinase